MNISLVAKTKKLAIFLWMIGGLTLMSNISFGMNSESYNFIYVSNSNPAYQSTEKFSNYFNHTFEVKAKTFFQYKKHDKYSPYNQFKFASNIFLKGWSINKKIFIGQVKTYQKMNIEKKSANLVFKTNSSNFVIVGTSPQGGTHIKFYRTLL